MEVIGLIAAVLAILIPCAAATVAVGEIAADCIERPAAAAAVIAIHLAGSAVAMALIGAIL